MTLAAGNGTALWYLTRASGVVSLLLLTVGLVLGILGTVRWRSDRWPRFAVVSIHRNLTLFAIAFVALHVLTTIADGYVPVGFKDAVIPFVSRYRPLWLGFGAVAFDLLLALVVTSLLRARIGYRAWRAVHWLAYASWPFALVHGLGSGSDSRFGWFVIVTIACAAAVGAAVRGQVPAVLRLTLWGTAAGEGISMSNSSVTFAPVSLRGFSGKVVALQGNQLGADLTNPSGARLHLTIVLNLNGATST